MEKKKQQHKSLNDFYQNRLVRIILLAVVCLVLGLIDGFRSYVSAYYSGFNFEHFVYVVRWDITGWMIWIGFIPVIIWLCRRFPIARNNWLKSLLIFFPIGLIIALARTFFPALVHILIFEGYADLKQWLPSKSFILVTDFIIAYSFYLLALAFGQAINYYKQFREEELRASQLETQLSNAQLQALKMQLQPHFLFNALNSISALQIENSESAQEMIARLGDFLRLTLENIGAQEISLEQEIEFLRCYLDIEQVRFGDRLSTHIEITPDTRFCRVPNLILQPLVENAIKHGIASSKKNGRIDIRTVRENGWLKIEVEDNGTGIDRNNRTEIFRKGLGLANTQARLRKLYGSNFRFDLESAEKKGQQEEQQEQQSGLLITLRLPHKTMDYKKEIFN